MKHLILLDLSHTIMDQFAAHKGLIAAVAIGFIAGLAAQLVTPGKGFGFVATIAIGMLSCYLCNKFLIKQITFVQSHLLRELIGAVLIAILITLVVNLIFGRDHKKEKQHH